MFCAEMGSKLPQQMFITCSLKKPSSRGYSAISLCSQLVFYHPFESVFFLMYNLHPLCCKFSWTLLVLPAVAMKNNWSILIIMDLCIWEVSYQASYPQRTHVHTLFFSRLNKLSPSVFPHRAYFLHFLSFLLLSFGISPVCLHQPAIRKLFSFSSVIWVAFSLLYRLIIKSIFLHYKACIIFET